MHDNIVGDPNLKKPLNALSLPNGLATEEAPPFDLQEVMWARTIKANYTNREKFPTADFHWFLVASANAGHAIHIDANGMATYVKLNSGQKIWSVGYDPERRGLSTFDLEKDASYDWNSANKDKWEMDGIVLTPGSVM